MRKNVIVLTYICCYLLTFVVILFRTLSIGLNLTIGAYWLGLDNIGNGTWMWLNGDVAQPHDIMWSPRSPASTGHNCGYMQNDKMKNLTTDNWWSCTQNAAHALCESEADNSTRVGKLIGLKNE